MVGKGLSVRARLGLLLVFVNAAVLVAAGYAWYALTRLNTEFTATIAKQNQVESASDLARRAHAELWAELHEWSQLLLVVGDSAQEAKRLDAFKAHGAQVADLLDALAAQLKALDIAPAAAQEAMREHATLQSRYLEAARSLRAGNLASLQDADRSVRGIDRAVSDRLEALVKTILKRGDALADDAAAVAASEERRLVTGLALVVLAALLVSAAAGWLTIAMITRRLVHAGDIARVVAAGDLTTRIESGADDELGELLGSLGHMNDSLAGLVARVRSSAQSVIAASSEIAAGNSDLSARTEEQASSLEETAASMEEMTASVNHTSGNAGEATRFADSAAEVARRGGGAVDEVVRVMAGIRESSNRIGEIIGVIDSIAFQTNILALNAAVEAARAGEQGRGFAVVAGEVRSLAMRCATAAAEVKGLITDSVDRVQEGARRADDAGRTMKDVVDAVSRVSLLIREIAAATSEQSAGIAQVGQAVTELEKANQHNASLAHQSNAAAESLNRLAAELTEAVAAFRTTHAVRVTDSERRHPASRAMPAPWKSIPLPEMTQ